MSALRVYSRKRARSTNDSSNDFTDNNYERVAKRSKIATKTVGGLMQQYLSKMDQKIFSGIAGIKAKIDQVGSDEENGQLLLNAFSSRSTEDENRLKSESEKLNKLYHEFNNYKTSHDEIYEEGIRMLHAEKQNFARVAELRMEKDKLGTIHDQIDQIQRGNDSIKMIKLILDDYGTMVMFGASVFKQEMGQDPTTTTTTTS